MYQDETLSCIDCSAPFTFTSGEQDFYALKGFTNKPNRCPDCRAAKKAQRGGSEMTSSRRPQREMFTATCGRCGKPAQVPFQPRGDRPVFCRDCFTPKAQYR